MAHSPVILLGLQLLNAIFIGILGGIGMLYFQDLMPGQAGSLHHALYQHVARGLDQRRISGWASSPRSGIITLCSGLRW